MSQAGGAALLLLRSAGWLVLGAAVGVTAVVVHPEAVGLALALAATAAAAWAVPSGWPSRVPFVVGWDVVVVLASRPRASGGFLVARDLPGFTLLGASLVLLLAAILTTRPLVPPEPEADDSYDA